jgi:hypothetical protein
MHCSRVDAFRHRAAPTIADPAQAGHGNPWLTLTGPSGSLLPLPQAGEVKEFAAKPVQSNGLGI